MSGEIGLSNIYFFGLTSFLSFVYCLDSIVISVFHVFHSESGTFIGLGTVTGSVAIHIAFSLQVNTHTQTDRDFKQKWLPSQWTSQLLDCLLSDAALSLL